MKTSENTIFAVQSQYVGQQSFQDLSVARDAHVEARAFNFRKQANGVLIPVCKSLEKCQEVYI